jgi:hypothetical protein
MATKMEKEGTMQQNMQQLLARMPEWMPGESNRQPGRNECRPTKNESQPRRLAGKNERNECQLGKGSGQHERQHEIQPGFAGMVGS